MTTPTYGEIKETRKEPKFPVRNLLRVPHQDLAEGLIVSREAFGRNTFRGNIAEMNKNYCYPNSREIISFREPTTSESISAAAFDFKNLAKPEIFDPSWLQTGYIVRTFEGVYANTKITNETKLRKLRDKAKKVNGIWILENGEGGVRDFGFAPYKSFKTGVQDCYSFAEGGLARVLEHTSAKVAGNLRTIALLKFHSMGVKVNFDPVSEPTLEVVNIRSGRYIGGRRLIVNDYDLDDSGYGCAFGVLKLEKTK
jgi:hypothetical protein